jgi:hypothetical protein
MLIIREDSVINIPRDLNILVIGRIKLSEIVNMDQSPLLFEFLKGRIYVKRGEKTVRLKEGKSGHDKRQCTL